MLKITMNKPNNMLTNRLFCRAQHKMHSPVTVNSLPQTPFLTNNILFKVPLILKALPNPKVTGLLGIANRNISKISVHPTLHPERRLRDDKKIVVAPPQLKTLRHHIFIVIYVSNNFFHPPPPTIHTCDLRKTILKQIRPNKIIPLFPVSRRP